MSLSRRAVIHDEELAKKSDELSLQEEREHSSNWAARSKRQSSFRIRKRRLLLVALLVFVGVVFFKNMPTDLVPVSSRYDMRVPGQTVNGVLLPNNNKKGTVGPSQPNPPKAPGSESPVDSSPDTPADIEPAAANHKGTSEWSSLTESLRAASRKYGSRGKQKSVIFVASDSHSAARLISMACEMSHWNRNIVNFVMMGKSRVSIEELKDINGVGEGCNVHWHDGRLNSADQSSDERIYEALSSGLDRVHYYIQPQVYITEELNLEDPFLVRGVSEHAEKVDKRAIQLPKEALQDLFWITRLDTGALSAWNDVSIDILIQAQRQSSGSLIRLLKSIRRAEYIGFRYPHITIDLPTELDPAAERFLESYVWPPFGPDQGAYASQLTLRRRVRSPGTGPELAASRFVENFYPSRTRYSHVFLLSPQTEVAPIYFHYLMYHTLEYKYSSYSAHSKDSRHLAGISVVTPSRKLDDTQVLVLPGSSGPQKGKESSYFLWQAPNTNAVLYFGDKWREYHSYLSRLTALSPAPEASKSISGRVAAFAEYLLQLMRARNYFVLYPHFQKDAIATTHNELFHYPEEFEDQDHFGNPEDELPYGKEKPLTRTGIKQILPENGDLPELFSLPRLSFSGEPETQKGAAKAAKAYEADLRGRVGGCPPNYSPQMREYTADDLFCERPPQEDEMGQGIPDDSPAPPDGQPPNYRKVSETEKKAMKAESLKHLERQGKKKQT